MQVKNKLVEPMGAMLFILENGAVANICSGQNCIQFKILDFS
jgi:hypothetical protein